MRGECECGNGLETYNAVLDAVHLVAIARLFVVGALVGGRRLDARVVRGDDAQD